jgi:small-conductance mechanosensitive channel
MNPEARVTMTVFACIRWRDMSEERRRYFAERLRAIRSTPEFRRSKKAARIRAASILIVGLPVALVVAALADFLGYGPKVYVPLTFAISIWFALWVAKHAIALGVAASRDRGEE